MPVTEQEKADLLAVNAKLTDARAELKTQDKELNELRTKVVTLEDKSVAAKQAYRIETLEQSLSDCESRAADTQRQLEKAQRDIDADGAARDLLAAIKSALGI